MSKIAALSKPTILLHWTVAILFIGVFAMGIYVADFAEPPAKFTYMGWHKSMGLVVLVLPLQDSFGVLKKAHYLRHLQCLNGKQQLLTSLMAYCYLRP